MEYLNIFLNKLSIFLRIDLMVLSHPFSILFPACICVNMSVCRRPHQTLRFQVMLQKDKMAAAFTRKKSYCR